MMEPAERTSDLWNIWVYVLYIRGDISWFMLKAPRGPLWDQDAVAGGFGTVEVCTIL